MKFEDCDLSSVTIESTWKEAKKTTQEMAMGTDQQNLKEIGTDPMKFPEKETQTDERTKNDRGDIRGKIEEKIHTHSSGVCPQSAAFSSTGILAVGNANGDVIIAQGESLLSTNKIHSLSVSYLCWTTSTTLITTSLDGSITQSNLKGNRLEIIKTKSLSVSDLPSKHRKASSSSKALLDVRLFNGATQCSVSPQDGATRIHSIDGTLLDAVRIEAQMFETMNGNLLILSDRETLVFYNVDEKKEVYREKLATQALAANSQDEIFLIDAKNNILCFKVARK
ncbi:unnamed protein product, partial [Mesorhabditis belari]|uniref:Uncharacterized protein n=1 Tax=Mesorhabditis belari TaxID=2138241 RepID=A0AAF3F3H1_9BILA